MSTTAPTEADYFAHDDERRVIWSRLRDTTNAAERHQLLSRAAEIGDHEAALHTAVFGPDPNPDEDGRDLSESLASAARLLRIVANAERCRAESGVYEPLGEDLEWPVLGYLDDLALGGGRRRLLRLMAQTWAPVVGGQAVETIYRLPAPAWWRSDLFSAASEGGDQ